MKPRVEKLDGLWRVYLPDKKDRRYWDWNVAIWVVLEYWKRETLACIKKKLSEQSSAY